MHAAVRRLAARVVEEVRPAPVRKEPLALLLRLVAVPHRVERVVESARRAKPPAQDKPQAQAKPPLPQLPLPVLREAARALARCSRIL